nr:uncharacterized protein LOC116148151 [Camelus dromedarius]
MQGQRLSIFFACPSAREPMSGREPPGPRPRPASPPPARLRSKGPTLGSRSRRASARLRGHPTPCRPPLEGRTGREESGVGSFHHPISSSALRVRVRTSSRGGAPACGGTGGRLCRQRHL